MKNELSLETNSEEEGVTFKLSLRGYMDSHYDLVITQENLAHLINFWVGYPKAHLSLNSASHSTKFHRFRLVKKEDSIVIQVDYLRGVDTESPLVIWGYGIACFQIDKTTLEMPGFLDDKNSKAVLKSLMSVAP